MEIDKVTIVRDKTRMEQLIERFNSKQQAAFYINRSGTDFKYYEEEHQEFYKAFECLSKALEGKFKSKVIYREYLPNYIFSPDDVIIVFGQDGLLANTAKYTRGLPIIGVNPDESRYDGVLLKHHSLNIINILNNMVKDRHAISYVTMAKATFNDGQTLLAFNDFFIGAASHISFKYAITHGKHTEQQSSSGILVSTGAGSTGWLSSVYNMSGNIVGNRNSARNAMPWDTDYLQFVVREPFLSKTTGIGIGKGKIIKHKPLEVTSYMPANGVLFSDGIETDFIPFNSGSTVTIGLASEKACLVM